MAKGLYAGECEGRFHGTEEGVPEDCEFSGSLSPMSANLPLPSS